MAGHSQFANIKHRKAAVDKKRSRAFSIHAKAIMTAARLGGADPKMNARLALAIEKARADNTPKDNIERAILKGTGQLPGQQLEDIRYEAYGPGGVGMILDVVTDNRNRTVPEIRSLLERHGGRLAETNSVMWMFDARAVVGVPAAGRSEDELLEWAMELGGDDLKRVGDSFEIVGDPTSLNQLAQGLKAKGLTIEKAEIAMVPKNPVAIESAEAATKLLDLVDELDEHEDVNNSFVAVEIPESVLAQLK